MTIIMIIMLLVFIVPSFVSVPLHFERKNNKRIANTVVSNSLPQRTVYDCMRYEDHTLSVKMAEAGVIEQDEIVLCDDGHCLLCQSERGRRRRAHARREGRNIFEAKSDEEKFNQLRDTDPRYKGYTCRDYVFQQELRRRGLVAKPHPDAITADFIEADGNKPISSVNVCGVCGMLTKYRGMEICSVCNKTQSMPSLPPVARIRTEKRYI